MVDLQEWWVSGWLQGCHRCAFKPGMGLGIEEEPVWCPPTMEHSVSEKNRFTEGKKGKHKTQYPGRWYAVVANPSGQEMGGVGGGQGAWEPVNWDWKGKLWLCRRGRLKGQW